LESAEWSAAAIGTMRSSRNWSRNSSHGCDLVGSGGLVTARSVSAIMENGIGMSDRVRL
jgi:hypothetical protein